MQKKTTSAAENFLTTMQSDPQEVIAWAKEEIKLYEKLIKLVEKKTKK